MSDFFAEPAHYERLLAEHGGSLEQLAESLGYEVREGTVYVRGYDLKPNWIREAVSDEELERLFEYYGVETRDLELLRGRMIVEGAWAPAAVAVEDGRLVTYTDPTL